MSRGAIAPGQIWHVITRPDVRVRVVAVETGSVHFPRATDQWADDDVRVLFDPDAEHRLAGRETTCPLAYFRRIYARGRG